MIGDFSATIAAPKIFRFDDIDAFRSSVRHLDVDFTPLAARISAEQIILNLPGCDVNYTKSFPRIIDVQLGPGSTAVGFSMDDGVPIRFNGIERDRSAIVIGSGGATYSAVESTPRQYASIVFTPEIEDRGWPRTDLGFKIFETSQTAQICCASWSCRFCPSLHNWHRLPRLREYRWRSGNRCWRRSTTHLRML